MTDPSSYLNTHTVDEAKQLWCPYARASTNADSDTGVSVNRVATGKGQPDADCMCIADRCMMWLWWSAGLGRGYCGRARR